MCHATQFRSFPIALIATILLIAATNGIALVTVPPKDGILDETRALSEATHRLLAEELRQFRADLNCESWITATSFMQANVTLRRQAQTYRREWSAERPAVLMAYDRATNSGAMSFAPELWDRYPSAELIEIMQENRRILSTTTLTLDERLTMAARSWIDRLRLMESIRLRQTLPIQQEEKRLAKTAIALLVGAAMLAAAVGMLSRRRTASGGQRIHFPEVHVGMRFGAPYGGGVTSEINTDGNRPL